MKTFVVGDIHGNYKALMQCIERSGIDYKKDELICLGDVCDGFPFVKDCFDELLKFKKLIYIMGNHDWWALEWYDRDWPEVPGIPEPYWVKQGGDNTMKSYPEGFMPETHLQLLKIANFLYVDKKNRLFVHGGIDPDKPDSMQDPNTCMWDRDLLLKAWMTNRINPQHKYSMYDKIFIGHTATSIYNRFKYRTELPEEIDVYAPIFACNVINIDTSAGWDGKLTIMDVDTQQYWQSDLAMDLYPDTPGRTRRTR